MSRLPRTFVAFAAVAAVGALCGCLSTHPDHFYTLGIDPPDPPASRPATLLPATLKVTLPGIVDRSEMILGTGADGVLILDHERWATPFSDLVAQTLARDLEHRRGDLLVSEPGAGRAPTLKITVDIVQVTLRLGSAASMEAHWRIVDERGPGETVGSDVFKAKSLPESYAEVARSASEVLSQIADRVASGLPSP